MLPRVQSLKWWSWQALRITVIVRIYDDILIGIRTVQVVEYVAQAAATTTPTATATTTTTTVALRGACTCNDAYGSAQLHGNL